MMKKYGKRKNPDRSTQEKIFTCPMCCNESFTSQGSLKRHLVNVFENVKCPICQQIFIHVDYLIQHLAVECKGSKNYKSRDTRSSSNIYKRARKSNGSYTIPEETMAIVSFESSTIQPDTEGNHFLTNSFDHYILNGNSNTSTNDVYPLEEANNESDSSEESEFQCSACNVSFTNITEHVQKYHAGQEIQIQNEVESKLEEDKVEPSGRKSKINENTSLKKDTPSSINKNKNQTTDTGRRQAVFKGQNKKIKKNPTQSAKNLLSPVKTPTPVKKNTPSVALKEEAIVVVPGYWHQRSSLYNYIRDEGKMKLLDPTFVPPKEKLNMCVKYNMDNFASMRVKLWFDELTMIQIVSDATMIACKRKVPNNLIVYVIDKNVGIDKNKLGKIGKVIEELPHIKKKKKKSSSDEDDDDDEDSTLNTSKSKVFDKKQNKNHIDLYHEQFIHVLQVEKGSNKEITIENINFKFLPSVPNYIVPFVDSVGKPVIPLLENAKILKWYCTLCFSLVNNFTNAFQHQCR